MNSRDLVVTSTVFLLILLTFGNFLYLGYTTNPAEGDPDNSVKFMTFNTYGMNFDQDRYSKIMDMIENQNPDIIGLQEVFSQPDLGIDPAKELADRMGYYVINLGTDLHNVNGLSIVSKWPIANITVVDLPDQKGDRINRTLLLSEIEVDGYEFTVAVSHLSIPTSIDDQKIQVAQIEIIEEYGSVDHFALLCSCNTPDHFLSKGYQKLTGVFDDVWITASEKRSGGNTYPANDPKVRVDYIWSNNIEIVDKSAGLVGGPAFSDHLGVMAELSY